MNEHTPEVRHAQSSTSSGIAVNDPQHFPSLSPVSYDAMLAVEDHSPYVGEALTIHLILARAADERTLEVFLKNETLAQKARCSVRTVRRVRTQMVADGLLELVTEATRGHPAVYRMILPQAVDEAVDEGTPVSSHPDVGGTSCVLPLVAVGGTSETVGGTNGASALLVKDKGKDKNNNPAIDTTITALCGYLQDRIAEHRPTRARPPITERWRHDMDLLMRRGPLNRVDPEPLSAEKIRTTIDLIFAKLAEPSSSGFCWADQIRSPGNLRAKWEQMAVAYHRSQIKPVRKGAFRRESERMGDTADLGDVIDAAMTNGHRPYIDVEALPL